MRTIADNKSQVNRGLISRSLGHLSVLGPLAANGIRLDSGWRSEKHDAVELLDSTSFFLSRSPQRCGA